MNSSQPTVYVRRAGGTPVIALAGPFRLGVPFDEFRKEVSAQAVRGGLIILDLHGLTSIDAVGVGELVGAYSIARLRGARLHLEGGSPEVRRSLANYRLGSLFPAGIPATLSHG